MTRIVAVVPAAGHGTRLRSGLGAWQGSKEVMPVAGRPVIDHLLDRLLAAGTDEVRVVVRPEKRDLLAHLRGRACTLVLGEPADVAASLLLGVAGLASDDVVLSGFPDTIWSPRDGFRRLLAAHGPADVVLGLFALPDVRAADEVLLDGKRVVAVHPKPAVPVSDLTWGCVAARQSALARLDEVTEPGELWNRMAQEKPGSVVGVRLGSDFVDVGTPEGRALAGP